MVSFPHAPMWPNSMIFYFLCVCVCASVCASVCKVRCKVSWYEQNYKAAWGYSKNEGHPNKPTAWATTMQSGKATCKTYGDLRQERTATKAQRANTSRSERRKNGHSYPKEWRPKQRPNSQLGQSRQAHSPGKAQIQKEKQTKNTRWPQPEIRTRSTTNMQQWTKQEKPKLSSSLLITTKAQLWCLEYGASFIKLLNSLSTRQHIEKLSSLMSFEAFLACNLFIQRKQLG